MKVYNIKTLALKGLGEDQPEELLPFQQLEVNKNALKLCNKIDEIIRETISEYLGIEKEEAELIQDVIKKNCSIEIDENGIISVILNNTPLVVYSQNIETTEEGGNFYLNLKVFTYER